MKEEWDMIPLLFDELQPLVKANKPILVLLAEAYPQAAARKSGEGRLPIHYAIESGKTLDRGILNLIYGGPHTLDQRDPKTMLNPCLLAAASPRCRLSTAFELLKL